MIFLFCLITLWNAVSGCSQYSDCLQCELDFKCTFKKQCEALFEPTASPFSIHKAENCYFNHNLKEEMENLCLTSENETETVFQALPSSSPSFCSFSYGMQSSEEYELNLNLEGSSNYFLEVIVNDKTETPLVLNRGTYGNKIISVKEAYSLKIYIYSTSSSNIIKFSIYLKEDSSSNGIIIFMWIVVGAVSLIVIIVMLAFLISMIIFCLTLPAPSTIDVANEPIAIISPFKQSYVNNHLKEKVSEKQEKCTICLELVKVGDSAGNIKCNHLFHFDCIKQWMLTAKEHKCPNCNQILVEDKPFVVVEENEPNPPQMSAEQQAVSLSSIEAENDNRMDSNYGESRIV